MFKNLFPKKIKVELVDAINSGSFGQVKLSAEQLPASFPADKETIMHIEGEDWIVDRAEPMNAEEFIKNGKLTLWLKKVLKINPANIRYSVPTISNELPAFSDNRHFNDFTLTIHEDDWRQMEFVPANELISIQQELTKIEPIIFPDDDPDFDAGNGFSALHVRTIKRTSLAISWEEFIRLINVQQQGSLVINGYVGYVQNGFACKTASHTYYGTVSNDRIAELCVDDFDTMDDEINNLLLQYNLLFVCWCRGSIASS
jgi:hypothetical protein